MATKYSAELDSITRQAATRVAARTGEAADAVLAGHPPLPVPVDPVAPPDAVPPSPPPTDAVPPARAPADDHASGPDGVAAPYDALMDAELGALAYALGRHLFVHGDHQRAEQWLRIAADRRVGDAALWLARMLETAEVESFNIALGLTIEGVAPPDLTTTSEASHWFARAAEEGYGPGFGPPDIGDDPYLGLACCEKMAGHAAAGRAQEIIEAARAQADKIVTQAKGDARLIRKDAESESRELRELTRAEFSEFSAKSRALEGMILRQAAVLRDLEVDPRPGRVRRLLGVLGAVMTARWTSLRRRHRGGEFPHSW